MRQEPVAVIAELVANLPDATPLSQVDLETYHTVALAQANAVQALRGLIEELRRHTLKQ